MCDQTDYGERYDDWYSKTYSCTEREMCTYTVYQADEPLPTYNSKFKLCPLSSDVEYDASTNTCVNPTTGEYYNELTGESTIDPCAMRYTEYVGNFAKSN